ncbi:MAG: hypothetical protein AAB685_02760 [Patescibacteria group bacterium]
MEEDAEISKPAVDVEDIVTEDSRTGKGDWGKHGEGNYADVDGRKSRMLTRRNSRQGKVVLKQVSKHRSPDEVLEILGEGDRDDS